LVIISFILDKVKILIERKELVEKREFMEDLVKLFNSCTGESKEMLRSLSNRKFKMKISEIDPINFRDII